MADLIGFDGFLNTSTPFTPKEHKALYKTNVHYQDFSFGNNYNATCEYPRFWDETGSQITKPSTKYPDFDDLVGCYDSEFDQYGDTEAFGVIPDWQRQLSKFASVQDRLREWIPSVREKIQAFSCLTIGMLDIDGFRFDKATQVTVDAQAEFGDFMRQCAKKFGKSNFFMPGEITGGNTFGSVYLGRGREPQQAKELLLNESITLRSDSDDKFFLREKGKNALDAAAFHYSIYRSLTRFLGMDGNLTAGFDVPTDFVDTWNTMLTTNDLVNPNTGIFDPRHMYGATNQDVFRWPSIRDGSRKMLLALFVTTLHMPGIPLLTWGEEQEFYVLDNTADNYIFGRQPLSSAIAWQKNGCYNVGSTQYYQFPVDAALRGCNDDAVSLDHRDPASPVRNVLRRMYHLREQFPVLNDGYFLQKLSNLTHLIVLPGSNGTATEVGLRSVMRNRWFGLQDLGGQGGGGNQSVWLVYHNDNTSVKYEFDCTSNETALISNFDAGTTVRNLLPPYDEITLKAGPKKLGIDLSEKFNGCADEMTLDAFEFRAYVPKDKWLGPKPMVTKFVPGHDARVVSTVGPNDEETVAIELQFSHSMDCAALTKSLEVVSRTATGVAAQIDEASVSCGNVSSPDANKFAAGVLSQWSWKANLVNVTHGVHAVSVVNASSADGMAVTDSIDHFWFRIGATDNPIVFPRVANYSQGVYSKDSSGTLVVSHKAAGADKWRYSTNWGSSWSDWFDYDRRDSKVTKQSWSGTKAQEWSGEHIILQYWSKYAGSSSHIQHADLDWSKNTPRRFPHLFAEGPWNLFGFDGGLKNWFEEGTDGVWRFNLMTEWPSSVQVNVWGINPDGQPDRTMILGNLSNNGILERIPPDALAPAPIDLKDFPPAPYLAYRIQIRESDYSWQVVPSGSRLQQILVFSLLWIVPVATGVISIWAYMGAFYNVKFNKIGIIRNKGLAALFGFRRKFQKLHDKDEDDDEEGGRGRSKKRSSFLSLGKSIPLRPTSQAPTITVQSEKRRTVLIATMEYDIEDWGIKIKIGGLGVMAQLMGKALTHQDLIWVVPCVGGIEYPIDQPAEPMTVTILGKPYEIAVQYHQLKNITYVLLDAPIFRQQSKSEPYPPRMDDLDSAVYYSAWNACIAEAIKRFPVDIYHINDYHGAAAPLYLLPRTIPCALSLHNAEFQGLWPMRTPKEGEEVCAVYNLPPETVKSYVQFGEVFNLLHAGASYLRVHQKGYGAVGVSNKYGERSYARYPIFWGLKKIGKLPNPDPTDVAPVNEEEEAKQEVVVDPGFEAARGGLRRQAQEWAGLTVDPEAELFVFVGRWSNQKGVDLIADVFPAVLEKHPKVQLICVGPVIDLYGKFAALKLARLMEKYPGRVYSKPEFTQLPPYIFSGAEFALIPSRDEPFGLVAVEFGRKGALGVGARVGGLGQMPGWWFTVESTTTKHLQHQFKSAIEEALSSKQSTRAMMRARSAKQRFPVATWVKSLDEIQSTAIKVHWEENTTGGLKKFRLSTSPNASSIFGAHSRNVSMERLSVYEADPTDHEETTVQPAMMSGGLSRSLSLGVRNGPGHRGRHRQAEADINEDTDDEHDGAAEVTISVEEAEASRTEAHRNHAMQQLTGRFEEQSLAKPDEPLRVGRTRDRFSHRFSASTLTVDSINARRRSSLSPSRPSTELLSGDATPHARPSHRRFISDTTIRNSVLSLSEVKGEKHDFSLQKVDPTFNDTNGEFYRQFEQMLAKLDAKNSETDLAIEPFLVDSEKDWFKRFREAKYGGHSRDHSRDDREGRSRSRNHSRNASRDNSRDNRRDSSRDIRGRSPNPRDSLFGGHSRDNSRDARGRGRGHERNSLRAPSIAPSEDYNHDHDDSGSGGRHSSGDGVSADDEFLLGHDYVTPSFLKRWMQKRIGDWPLYSLFLALGQIIAANSYQITLLTGAQNQETATKLYVVGAIYIVTSCVWWVMYRRSKSVWVLSTPFLFYGLAFFFVGLSPFVAAGKGRDWMANVATGMYVTASSSGSLFFALNFGDEGKSFFPRIRLYHLGRLQADNFQAAPRSNPGSTEPASFKAPSRSTSPASSTGEAH